MPNLQFGLSLNNRASVFLKSFPPTDMIRMAEIADELALHSVWVGDSLIDSPRYEPTTILGAVAGRTKKVKIGGSIIQPHFRNPILLALTWATLDRLSNGRTILTLGIGGGTPTGVAKEAELVGIDPTNGANLWKKTSKYSESYGKAKRLITWERCTNLPA